MKRTDVVVAGRGLAGITAALALAERGKSVRLVSRGAGTLAIAGGTVDVLGYAGGHLVQGDPLAAVNALPEEHPYRKTGAERLREALNWFCAVAGKYGLPYAPATNGRNVWMPTIAGTFRPTYLSIGGSCGRSLMEEARRICVVGVHGLKDAHAGLAAGGFRQYEKLRDKEIVCADLSNPLGRTHRNATPLDVARHVDKPEGERWLLEELRAHAVRGGVFVLPPVLGVTRTADILASIARETGMQAIQMASLPPGVGGLCLEIALKKALRDAVVLTVENADVVGAITTGKKCEALLLDGADRVRELEADAFVLATGGFLGGGHVSSPGKAMEAVFALDLGAPKDVEDWSSPDIFAEQAYAKLGVRVNARLNPVDGQGGALFDNVHFAGRALAGYDFITEKSGYGVALASGYHAARVITEGSHV